MKDPYPSSPLMEKCRLLIVEDHTLLREGLRSLLSQTGEVEVIGEAADGFAAIELSRRLRPDLVLMDISMPGMNGIEAIREIRRRDPAMRFLVLTVHDSEEYVRRAFSAGAGGYILKDASRAELLAAIQTVRRGGRYLSPGVSARMFTMPDSPAGQAPVKSPRHALTLREREILKLVAEGNTNRDIAARFNISAKTVDKHRANLMKKLDLHNTAALTAFAITSGLLASGGSGQA